MLQESLQNCRLIYAGEQRRVFCGAPTEFIPMGAEDICDSLCIQIGLAKSACKVDNSG